MDNDGGGGVGWWYRMKVIEMNRWDDELLEGLASVGLIWVSGIGS